MDTFDEILVLIKKNALEHAGDDLEEWEYEMLEWYALKSILEFSLTESFNLKSVDLEILLN